MVASGGAAAVAPGSAGAALAPGCVAGGLPDGAAAGSCAKRDALVAANDSAAAMNTAGILEFRFMLVTFK